MKQIQSRKPGMTGRGERGQALVEFALVIPILVLLMMGVMDLGRGIYAYNVVSSAAREGARYGIVDPKNNSGIITQAKANTAALDNSQITATASCIKVLSFTTDNCDQGNHLRVVVTYNFKPVTAFFATLRLSAESEMTIE